MKVPPSKSVKERAKASSLPVVAKEKTKEVKSISPQMKPPQEPAKQKPADVVSGQNLAKAGKGAVPEQQAQAKQSLQTSAPGEGVE
jgi:hypothetical protein